MWVCIISQYERVSIILITLWMHDDNCKSHFLTIQTSKNNNIFALA